MKPRTDQGRLASIRAKRREETWRGRGSVTSAITSSEMHLDRVSICQNKAASTAASLIAMDVNGRGREGGGGHWHIQRDTKDCCCTRRHITHAHANTTAAAPFFLARSRSHQSFDTKFLQSCTVIAIEPLSCSGMCVCVFMHLSMSVSACEHTVCMCTLPTVFLVVRYLPPSLIVMNLALCQSLT